MSWIEPSVDETKLAHDYRPLTNQNISEKHRYRLIQVLALALRIDPLLLRNARLRFAPRSDTEWETDIWFSSLMRARNSKFAVMREGTARTLIDDLATIPDEYQTAWQFVEQHTRHWPETDRLEQRLRLAAAKNEQNVLTAGFEQMLKTLQQTTNDDERRECARWVKGSLSGLISEGQHSQELAWLQQYIAAALGSSGQILNRNAAVEPIPEWLLHALPKVKGQNLYLRLRPGVLECLKKKDDLPYHELALSLPLPTPILIAEDSGKSRWEGFWPGRRIKVANRLKILTLQTLTGERIRITVKHDQKTDSKSTNPPADNVVLVYMSPDEKIARELVAFLKKHNIKVKLLEEHAEKPADSSAADNTQILRLWTRTAADYWQRISQQTPWIGGQGLILRTEPSAPLLKGMTAAQVYELSDWKKKQDKGAVKNLLEAVNHFLANPKISAKTNDIPLDESEENIHTGDTPENKIDLLLKEIKDPATEPPRRLEFGDRLAEIGDTRPGVGVREIEVPVEPANPDTEYSTEIQDYLDEINNINTEPPRRLEISDELARLGDPRKGVGLDEKGLPEFDWVKVSGGPFIYQNGETIKLPTFYMSRFPVTNAQFQAFVDTGGYDGKVKKAINQLLGSEKLFEQNWWHDLKKPKPGESRWNQPNRPKTNIDWYEVMAFCRWLSAMLDLEPGTIRLPNEQEWEKVARGEKGLDYPWGNEYISGYANIDETENKKGSWYLQQTTAVGMYPHGESPFGVQDMCGNVWEWCLNKYNHPKVTDPDTSGDSRVLRGGSWINLTDYARADYRYRYDPYYRGYNRGFRVLSSVPIR